MKDGEIKRRLSEVGLPTQGDRRALIRRHQEFTLLYNTQCDALEPKSSETFFLMPLIRLRPPDTYSLLCGFKVLRSRIFDHIIMLCVRINCTCKALTK